MSIVALTGGVGGAKLSLGLAQLLTPEEVIFVVNVGDDFEHFGLNICPDLDTLTYTLADVVNKDTGWGRDQEAWLCLETIKLLGGEDWFRLGDRDLALHLIRSKGLREGKSLTQVTRELTTRLGIQHDIFPATDDQLRTQVETDEGILSFQEYFVRRKCEPTVKAIRYQHAKSAKFNHHVSNSGVSAVIICPSNPFLSIDPILAIPEAADWLKQRNFPVIAVSPIIASQAVKGPTAKIMAELNLPINAVQVASHYGEYVDGFVLDNQDGVLARSVEELGVTPMVTSTWMQTLEDKTQLAQDCLAFVKEFQTHS